jgi:hypothetical protein
MTMYTRFKYLIIASLISATPIIATSDQESSEYVSRSAIYQSTLSPSRHFMALSAIALTEVSATFRMRIRVLVVDISNATVQEISTELHPSWVVIWAPGDVLLVSGNDEEDGYYQMLAYEFRQRNPYARRAITADQIALLRSAFISKYGKSPLKSTAASAH